MLHCISEIFCTSFKHFYHCSRAIVHPSSSVYVLVGNLSFTWVFSFLVEFFCLFYPILLMVIFKYQKNLFSMQMCLNEIQFTVFFIYIESIFYPSDLCCTQYIDTLAKIFHRFYSLLVWFCKTALVLFSMPCARNITRLYIPVVTSVSVVRALVFTTPHWF